ncbi:MAG: hypothetical protein AB8F74_01995 [Saprospiraceae bacterium]
MKLNHLYTIVFLFLFLGKLNAQIQKGDYFFSPSFSSSYATELNDRIAWSPNIQYSKMVTDKLMIGGGVSFNDSSLGYIKGIRNHRRISRMYSFDVNIRWYFTNHKWAFFAFAKSNFRYNDYGKIILPPDHSDYDELLTLYSNLYNQGGTRTELGFGLDYFIRKNVIIESVLGLNALRTGSLHNFSSNSNQLYLRTSTRVFFGNKLRQEIQSIKNHFLRAGNIILSGSCSVNFYFKEKYRRSFNLFPSISYFLNDKTQVNATFGYSKNIFLKQTGSTLRLKLGVKRYFQVISDFLISIQSDVTIRNVKDENSEITNQNLSIPIHLGFNYFHKRSKYSLEASYYFNFTDNHRSLYQRNNQRLALHLNWDYFLHTNVFVQTRLSTNYPSRQLELNNPINPFTEKISSFYLRSGIYFILGQ